MEEGKDFEDLDERELNELGNAFSEHGMWEDAIKSYLRSLALRKPSGDVRGQGIVLNNLGAAYYHEGRLQEAEECYQASRDIAHELGAELSELVALMNLVFLHFTEGKLDHFLRCADEAQVLAVAGERWEPLCKLSWLRGRLSLSNTDTCDTYQDGLSHYAEALSYASRDGETALEKMLSRVDAQAEQLAAQGSRGLALVLYDYLHVFAQDQGFSEGVLSLLVRKREEILRRPSLG
jgi:tetratricopeptide (TPR) repeat protein